MDQGMRELAPRTRGGGAFQEWFVILIDEVGKVHTNKASDDADEQGVQVVFVCPQPATKGGGAKEHQEPQRENELFRPVFVFYVLLLLCLCFAFFPFFFLLFEKD